MARLFIRQQQGAANTGERNRQIRHASFVLILVVLLFRRENATVQSVQGRAVVRPATPSSPANPPRGGALPSPGTGTSPYEKPAVELGNETLPELSELSDALLESRRDNMTIRFSNESWVLEWRAAQAAARARKPIREKDWSDVPCVDSKKWEMCDLADDRWGVNVVLLSFGRSGSSITWETMSSLASERGQPAREDIGGSSTSAWKSLEDVKPEEHGKCWLQRILCRHQYNNRLAIKEGLGKAEIIGTKWKPFLRSFNHTKSREALEWLGSNPYVKVIYNERNFLDVAISRFKHMSTNAPAHCYGEQCIQYHAQQLANTSVPVGFLRDTISMLDRQANYVAEILEEVKVPHIKVLYERLFYAKNAEEWMNIFRFVGVGPMTGLEMAHVRAHMTQFQTHSDDRSDTIANFDQIRKALRKTEYKKYLRPAVRKDGSVEDRGEVVLD